jgi:uncharacterized membrane protein
MPAASISSPLTRSQRAADAVTEFCGSWTFIIAFSFLTGGWIALNSLLILFGVFDPYPYILLNLFLTVVSTFQSPLIMMSQNRQMERDRDAVQGLHAKLDSMVRLLGIDQQEISIDIDSYASAEEFPPGLAGSAGKQGSDR